MVKKTFKAGINPRSARAIVTHLGSIVTGEIANLTGKDMLKYGEPVDGTVISYGYRQKS